MYKRIFSNIYLVNNKNFFVVEIRKSMNKNLKNDLFIYKSMINAIKMALFQIFVQIKNKRATINI